MPKIFEGNLDATGLKFGIIVSRFNDFIGEKLVGGAIDALLRHGANEADINVFKVPGSFEIPFTAKKLALTKKYDAIICLGVIIRGDTPHFEYIAAEVSKGIASVGLDTGTPIIFGVLTTENIEQAIERSGTKAGNKGFDAANAAIEIVNLFKNFS
ncbi:MAG: 6,7-dimethyl-8-ribityllumazine synthase [Thermodesulfobacteriota bacterium]|jgi:6,7-dimethyl-8-ribityllumazine synthase|nr:MAG: 6,7-dimethyl-8-ribityllumazine synthase [Thermodesulfobacteriota bacterium]